MKLSQTIAATTMLVVSSLVYAGFTQPFSVEVIIQPDLSGIANGDMATARFADNDVELIGCGIRTFSDGAGGVFEFGFCQAVMDDGTEEGLRGFCSTQNSGLLDTMKATGDYSFVTFSWNEFGECTRIGFSTQSFYIPDSKAK